MISRKVHHETTRLPPKRRGQLEVAQRKYAVEGKGLSGLNPPLQREMRQSGIRASSVKLLKKKRKKEPAVCQTLKGASSGGKFEKKKKELPLKISISG